MFKICENIFWFFLSIYRNILPNCARKFVRVFYTKNAKKIKQEVVEYVTQNSFKDSEYIDMLEYLRKYPLAIMPYKFVLSYKSVDLVFKDKECEMLYVLYNGKRMYFPRNWSKFKIRECFCLLKMEQDIESPHRYEYGKCCVQSGDIVIDCGTSEGIFALSVIDRASKIYCVECDPLWVEALEMTSRPYRDKIVIVNKYVSDSDNDNQIMLDTILENEFGSGVFIKADIEGAETNLLAGAKHTLSAHTNIRWSLCTYHQEDDAEKFNEIFKGHSYHTEFSRFMILLNDKALKYPYLRRGVIRAWK